jgi:hypothetical protein
MRESLTRRPYDSAVIANKLRAYRLCSRTFFARSTPTVSVRLDRRLRFVARLLDGEAMTDVCRNFGTSRKTGYKIHERYKKPHWSARKIRELLV